MLCTAWPLVGAVLSQLLALRLLPQVDSGFEQLTGVVQTSFLWDCTSHGHLVLHDHSWVVRCFLDTALTSVACSTTWALWYHGETCPGLLPTVGSLLLRDPSDLSFQCLFGTCHTFPGFTTSHRSLSLKNTMLFFVRASSLMDYFQLVSVRCTPCLYCTQ